MSPAWTLEGIAALVDGALSEPEAERARHAIDADPEAQGHARKLRRLNELLRAAYDVQADAPMPASIAAIFRADGGKVAVLPKRRRSGIWVPAAIAACLALALGLALYGPSQPPSGRLTAAVGEVPTGSALHLALERLPSGESSPEGVRPMLTFRDGAARPCREFEIDAEPTTALQLGVACRDAAGNWRVEIVVAAPEGRADGEGYVPASGSAENALDAALARLGAQVPLTPEEEATFLANRWKGAN